MATCVWARRFVGGLGIKMAKPECEVYVMIGDGSYLMMSQEIAEVSERETVKAARTEYEKARSRERLFS
jgi:TPP-dependent trihydroxycyclohexane-1,2-dione (THcHDO) dehydratase